jgi:DNA topoisomerase I
MREIASELANTPAVCRKSYVHAAVVEAFESGVMQRLAKRAARSNAAREKMLLDILQRIALKA